MDPIDRRRRAGRRGTQVARFALAAWIACAAVAGANEVPKGLCLAVEAWNQVDAAYRSEIWLLRGAETERLAAPENDQGVGDPCLSPDGKRLAYTFGPETRTGVAILSLDGKEHRVLIAPRPAAEDAGVVERAFHHPRIHPSGTSLVVTERVRTRTGEGAGAKETVTSRLHAIDLATGAAQELVVDRPIEPEALGWHADGKRLLLRSTYREDGATETGSFVCWGMLDGAGVTLDESLLPGMAVRTAAVWPGKGKLVVATADAIVDADAVKTKTLWTVPANEMVRSLACSPKDEQIAETVSLDGTPDTVFWFQAGSKERTPLVLLVCPTATIFRDPCWGPAPGGAKPAATLQANVPDKPPKLPKEVAGLEPCAACAGKGEITTPCSMCGGAGATPCPSCAAAGAHKCAVCGGDGRRRVDRTEVPCDACGGRGQYACGWCGGKKQSACMGCRGKKTLTLPCRDCLGLAVSRGTRPAGPIEGCAACRGFGQVQCARCNGGGLVPGTCPTCFKGVVPCYQCKGAWRLQCETCLGKGDILDPRGNGTRISCRDCKGHGWKACNACKNGALRDTHCQGKGQAARTPCPFCVGSGAVPCPVCGEWTK